MTKHIILALAAALVPLETSAQTRRINAPYFADAVRAPEAAVFWFGRVDPSRNYADVRVGYTPQELWIKIAVFDQWLWQDDAATRTAASLETWDAVTLLIDRNPASSGPPSSTAYRFVGELSWWRPRTDYQAVYNGNGASWVLSTTIPFTTETGWRGDSPNNGGADRGWVITYRIPFSSLGLSAAPAANTLWRLAVQLHDRDAAGGSATSDTFWPETYARDTPASWGQLSFGLRASPAVTPGPGAQTYTVRHGLNGAVVPDAMVGGGATCAEGVSFFQNWGSLNHAGSTTLVVQNQADVADWPCFSKFYVDFPLSALPAGRGVASATLTIYQFGGSDPSRAIRSLVQVSTINEAWAENAVTWNTAPMAAENVAQSWVDVIPAQLPWPGAARTWDLSWAVAQAYASGQTVLRLAIYEADSAYHSGKYFTSSDTGDWNASGRPTLQVVLDAAGTPPQAPRNFRVVTP